MSVDLIGFWLDVPRFKESARCAETDPDAFFPERGVRIGKIRDVCNRCEALDECLTYALDRELDGDTDGVWGGTSPEQRRRMRPRPAGAPENRARKPIQHGTRGGERTHRRRGESPCDDCRRAKNEDKARRRYAKKLLQEQAA